MGKHADSEPRAPLWEKTIIMLAFPVETWSWTPSELEREFLLEFAPH